MNKPITLQHINIAERDIYQLKGFKPAVVDTAYLKSLGVMTLPSKETLEALIKGSIDFQERLRRCTVTPLSQLQIEDMDLSVPAEIHNYTGACPTLTYELNPIVGCSVGCLYCLVTDGVHESPLKAYGNYHHFVAQTLEEKYQTPHYFYFSPKTEAFQDATLQTGIAHNILREFIVHYARRPESKARLFIASKAGKAQLLYKHRGESILDLMAQLKGRIQFNTSVSIMPSSLRAVLEPYAAPLIDRLDAVLLCQRAHIMAESALVQPILPPAVTDECLHQFFAQLRNANIINFKPEFLTVCMENLAMIGQLAGHGDKEMEKLIYEYYIGEENADHRKQRGRTAPNRTDSRQLLARLMNTGDQYDLSMSICYWVRQQLHITEELVPMVNQRGFQCLGYQTALLDT